MSDPKVAPNQNAPNMEAHAKASHGADENKLLAFALSAPLSATFAAAFKLARRH